MTNIAQKTLISVLGQPCVGKSTLVDKILADQEGVYCVDFDVVKRQLSGYYWKRDREFAANLTKGVLDLVVRSGKPIITLLPMPASKKHYDYYFDAAKADGYTIVTVMLSLNREDHIERYKVRLESIRKNNPGFTVKTLDEFAALLDQEFYIPDDAVVLDSGELDADALYDEFVKHI